MYIVIFFNFLLLYCLTVKCLGTEDRVTDAANVVAANPAILAFVTFPGHEIKDLYVHETTAAQEVSI